MWCTCAHHASEGQFFLRRAAALEGVFRVDLVCVEDEIELADILENVIEALDKHMDQVQDSWPAHNNHQHGPCLQTEP